MLSQVIFLLTLSLAVLFILEWVTRGWAVRYIFKWMDDDGFTVQSVKETQYNGKDAVCVEFKSNDGWVAIFTSCDKKSVARSLERCAN